jgi:periplasmic divalent cation tolerance protein
MSEALLIYTTWPDLESAHAFGSKAVHAGLAACANILGPMRSIYRWEGAVEQADETPLLLKTTRRQLEDLRAAFLSSHPYDTPAFVAWPLDSAASHGAFLDWVGQETAGPRGGV